jgi:hypothetical protein
VACLSGYKSCARRQPASGPDNSNRPATGQYDLQYTLIRLSRLPSSRPVSSVSGISTRARSLADPWIYLSCWDVHAHVWWVCSLVLPLSTVSQSLFDVAQVTTVASTSTSDAATDDKTANRMSALSGQKPPCDLVFRHAHAPFSPPVMKWVHAKFYRVLLACDRFARNGAPRSIAPCSQNQLYRFNRFILRIDHRCRPGDQLTRPVPIWYGRLPSCSNYGLRSTVTRL